MTKVKNKPTKILLIDDDPTLRKVYEMQFESYPQYQLLLASNVQDAEAIINQKQPELILLDLIIGKKKGVPIEKMDKQHGFNILSFLNYTPELKRAPVVVFTNLDNEADVERAFKLGAVDYWVKSQLLPSEVMERIRDRLKIEKAKTKVYESAARVRESAKKKSSK